VREEEAAAARKTAFEATQIPAHAVPRGMDVVETACGSGRCNLCSQVRVPPSDEDRGEALLREMTAKIPAPEICGGAVAISAGGRKN